MEGDEQVQDAPAESSPAPDQAQPTPAGAQNTELQPGQTAPQPKPQQTVPYDRFNQVIRQNQELRTAAAQLQGRIQQMETLQQKAQQQGGLSPTDQTTYQQAAQALKDIFKNDPELKSLLESGQTHQTVQTMREAQLRSMEQQGVQKILQYADTESLPKDDQSRKVFVKLVESMALTIPQAKERFAAGDLTLFDEALQLAKPLLAHIKREGQTQLLDTKQRTRNLPPASRGGAAGPPGLPKLDQDNPRAFTEALHKAAAQHLGSG